MRARYYDYTADNQVICQLCPHHCQLTAGQVGFCRGRKNTSGRMQLLHTGKITVAQLDPIEKKPFAMFMPGSNVFSIGGFGCNFDCQFCQNWPIVYREERLYEVNFETLINHATRGSSIGFAFTYNEPTVWYEYMLALAEAAKRRGAINVLVSNGYINQQPFAELLDYIDAVNIDVKFADNASYRQHATGNFDHVIARIRQAHRRIHVEVSMLIIDGINSAPTQLERMIQAVASIDSEIPVHLSRYYPAYQLTVPATSIATMQRARCLAERHLVHVFMGNMPQS